MNLCLLKELYYLFSLRAFFLQNVLASSHLFGYFITPSVDVWMETSIMLPIVRFGVDVIGTSGSIGGQELLKRPH